MPPPAYNFGFTSATLRPELCRVVAEAYLETRDWGAAKAHVVEQNLLQCDATSTLRRLEQELRGRLATLTDAQMGLLGKGVTEERVAMCWLAVVKRYAFIRDFAVLILREKWQLSDRDVRPSDYASFIETATIEHPELETIAPSTQKKVKSRLFTMLKEVGLLIDAGQRPEIQRPVLPPACQRVVQNENPQYLACFLFSDTEIDAVMESR